LTDSLTYEADLKVIRVTIHTILALKKIIGQREVEIPLPEKSTVESLLSRMVKTWGEKLSSYLFHQGSASPIPHIRIMVNGRDIGFLNGMETVLQDGDQVLILPLVAGG
jgi:molybdopterin synthase sulfur carrier subunit